MDVGRQTVLCMGITPFPENAIAEMLSESSVTVKLISLGLMFGSSAVTTRSVLVSARSTLGWNIPEDSIRKPPGMTGATAPTGTPEEKALL